MNESAETDTIKASSAPARSHEVATVVSVKIPPHVPREVILAGFDKAAPDFKKVPGLIRKSFTVNEEGLGGIYLWTNRAAAEAWFTPAWHSRVVKTYGIDGTVSYYDAPITIEGSNLDGPI